MTEGARRAAVPGGINIDELPLGAKALDYCYSTSPRLITRLHPKWCIVLVHRLAFEFAMTLQRILWCRALGGLLSFHALFFSLTGFWSGLSHADDVLYWEQRGDLWVAGNSSLEVAVNGNNGTVQRLLDKVSREDYCNQVIGPKNKDDANQPKKFTIGQRIVGLTLFDELREQEFSDLTGTATTSNWRTEKTGDSVTLSFEKRFPQAEFLVQESFQVSVDHLRWNVRIKKTSGPDRTLRVIQFAPLPLGEYQAWAPISDAPFEVKPYVPFAIEYGQSVSGPVGEGRWRTNIPMMVFYSLENHRALAFTCPFEIPAVRTRFLNNTSASSDFHWNSRLYPSRERPYFQVSQEYLGLRDRKDVETSLLISAHPADWRPALGWVYEKYRPYFDAAPSFDPWDGVYVTGYELMRDSIFRA